MKSRGFTIIELLVVTLIIGLLSTLGVISYSKIQKNSKEQYYKSTKENIVLAAKSYYNINKQELPTESYMKDVSLKTLIDNNYLEDIKDAEGINCDFENSKVNVEKIDKNDYKYESYLVCDNYQDEKIYGNINCSLPAANIQAREIALEDYDNADLPNSIPPTFLGISIEGYGSECGLLVNEKTKNNLIYINAKSADRNGIITFFTPGNTIDIHPTDGIITMESVYKYFIEHNIEMDTGKKNKVSFTIFITDSLGMSTSFDLSFYTE